MQSKHRKGFGVPGTRRPALGREIKMIAHVACQITILLSAPLSADNRQHHDECVDDSPDYSGNRKHRYAVALNYTGIAQQKSSMLGSH